MGKGQVETHPALDTEPGSGCLVPARLRAWRVVEVSVAARRNHDAASPVPREPPPPLPEPAEAPPPQEDECCWEMLHPSFLCPVGLQS